MRSIGAYEARTHLSRVLDEVQRGERVIITRKGQPVALLLPYPEDRPSLSSQIQAFRRNHRIGARGISLEEIRDFRSEGRK